MSYSSSQIAQSEIDNPKLWLRIVSERLSTVRYVFLVSIEDGIPTVEHRSALEYADAVLIGWPEADDRDVHILNDEQRINVSTQIENCEKRIETFIKAEREQNSDVMSDSLIRISECVANVRKEYQPDFPLPTFAEIRRYVESEWSEDMDRIEADAQEYEQSIQSGEGGTTAQKLAEHTGENPQSLV